MLQKRIHTVKWTRETTVGFVIGAFVFTWVISGRLPIKLDLLISGTVKSSPAHCCLKGVLFITTACLCTVFGHAWMALKIPCLKNDSCPPAENMLLIFMRDLCYDEKYIAEFIFICLSGKSEPHQWDAWLMNTLGWESIRIYIPHRKHLNVL